MTFSPKVLNLKQGYLGLEVLMPKSRTFSPGALHQYSKPRNLHPFSWA